MNTQIFKKTQTEENKIAESLWNEIQEFNEISSKSISLIENIAECTHNNDFAKNDLEEAVVEIKKAMHIHHKQTIELFKTHCPNFSSTIAQRTPIFKTIEEVVTELGNTEKMLNRLLK